jgi:hypothetical protein
VPRKLTFSILALVILLLKAHAAWAQEPALDVSFCDLAKHPKSFDAKLIRVRGRLSVFFEDFSLVAKNCDTDQGIWLTFGGDVPGIVSSTWNDMSRKPGVDIKLEGVSYGIKKDQNFRKLYALIAASHHKKPLYRVTATLTGTFLAGEQTKLPNGQTEFRGYGHLACCALLVITQVSDVESVPPANLRIRGTVIGPDGSPILGIVVFDDVLGGTPPDRQQTTTNGRGEFEFSDSGQLLRIEDPKYRPVALAVETGRAPVTFKLEEARRSDWSVPLCDQVENSVRRIGFSVLFALPTSLDSDSIDDEESRSLFIFSQGQGPASAELIISTWTSQLGDPDLDSDSREIRQRWIRDNSGAVIGIDARYQIDHGASWRSASFFGRDSASYSVPDRKPTAALDRLIDSACIAKP